ncbi:hypothetical protein QZH41_012718 [Actinostola sp. cb2023]|nr:hypothetical protein QZH41_012718 [Actinostola sp. cb2023]
MKIRPLLLVTIVKNVTLIKHVKTLPSTAICFYVLIVSKKTSRAHRMVSAALGPSAFMDDVGLGQGLDKQGHSGTFWDILGHSFILAILPMSIGTFWDIHSF